MKRKFAVLTVLGALLALAVPASSMAGIYPANSQIEIAGGSTPPTVGTSLGSCPITKVTGTTPASPANESAGSFPVTLTVGTCTSGTSLTWSSSFSLTYPSTTNSYGVNMQGLGALRYSSLPGCKLSGTFILWGIWSNGLFTPKAMKSGYHADSYITLTWADDGASCALSGKKETVRWSQQTVTGGGASGYPTSSQVNNLTTPAAQILVTP
jgi:hypothetical protein